MPNPMNSITEEYAAWFADLKRRLIKARQAAAVALNSAVIDFYWELGRDIVQKENLAEWGDGFIDRLSLDLGHDFPHMKGFSRRNLYALRQWYLFYSERFAIVPQVVAQLPWGHNRLIVSKIKDLDEALWYASSSIGDGWSRDTLELKIEKDEFRRAGRSFNNFPQTLPPAQSRLAGKLEEGNLDDV